MRVGLSIYVGLAILLTGGVVVRGTQRGNPDAAKLVNPVAATPESVAAGAKTYQRYCRGCHGAQGQGGPGTEAGPSGANLIDSKWDHGSTDGEIYSVIRNGVAPDFYMEPWAERISDTDIWHIVNYIRSLSTKG